ncbi:hypothetical protein LshimejAT787_0705820 [Lyophyllum shimeji]|uniref:Uncharacterized protein n=1 Tax=Lyophyllum shimeji TaxID=47721 RepID=A0A9P3PP67_LYOSH|nr:hypothetical protein LshimejAT787_0705820 [Lyophyllum shimeji]
MQKVLGSCTTEDGGECWQVRGIGVRANTSATAVRSTRLSQFKTWRLFLHRDSSPDGANDGVSTGHNCHAGCCALSPADALLYICCLRSLPP